MEGVKNLEQQPQRREVCAQRGFAGEPSLHPLVSLLGQRRVSPVSTMAVSPFHALYAAGFIGVVVPSSSPLPWPSPSAPRLGSLLAPRGVLIDDAAGFT